MNDKALKTKIINRLYILVFKNNQYKSLIPWIFIPDYLSIFLKIVRA